MNKITTIFYLPKIIRDIRSECTNFCNITLTINILIKLLKAVILELYLQSSFLKNRIRFQKRSVSIIFINYINE